MKVTDLKILKLDSARWALDFCAPARCEVDPTKRWDASLYYYCYYEYEDGRFGVSVVAGRTRIEELKYDLERADDVFSVLPLRYRPTEKVGGDR